MSKISLCCEDCNDCIDMESEDLEKEVPKFTLKHPTCKLQGFVSGRSIGIFSKHNKNERENNLNKVLN